MKIRRFIFWFVAVVTVTLWIGKNKPTTMTLMASDDTNAAPNQPRSPQPRPAAPEDKTALLREILNANDADIVFYGRLEDQFSNAVAGAQVSFSIQYENATTQGINRGQVVSDGNGFFTISGYKGANLGIMPKKPGYTLATSVTSFRYTQISPGYFVPDQNNPTVIKMWKLQGAQPLVSISQRYKLHYADAPMNIDLLAGKIVPSGGDLIITVKRPPGVISGRNRLDWSVQIEAVAGGLIDAAGQEKVTYWAPETGYQPSITLSASTNGHGVELIQQGFFVQSRNGQVYSKVGFSLRINSDPGGLMNITFGGVANASGSRNWEGDSNTSKP